jgi:hypothetical protein
MSQALAFKGGYDPGAIADFYTAMAESYMFRYAMFRRGGYGWL